jgi:hypothetical protein
MMVKCEVCGNVYGSPPRWPGGKCLVGGCQGTLRNYVRPNPVRHTICSELPRAQSRATLS